MTVTQQAQTADWAAASGVSRLPNYAVGDLLVMCYAVSGETSLSISDGSWTELVNGPMGTTAYTSAGGTGDHIWTLGDAAVAIWWKVATGANSSGDIDGPTVTTPSGDGVGAGVTFAYRQSGGLWNDPPIVAGDSDTCDANDIGLAGFNADGHNTLALAALDAGFASAGHLFGWVLGTHSPQGRGALHYVPPDFNMAEQSSFSNNPIIPEGVGDNSTEGVTLQVWTARPDASGRQFDPDDFDIGIVLPQQFGDWAGTYVLQPAGAWSFVVLDGPAPPATCFTFIGSRDDAGPTSQDYVNSLLPPGYATGDAVLCVIGSKFRDDNVSSYSLVWENDAGFAAHGNNGFMRTGGGPGDIDVQVFYKVLDGSEPTEFGAVKITWSNNQISPLGDDLVDVFVLTRVYRGATLLADPAAYSATIGGDFFSPVDFIVGASVPDSLVTGIMAPALVDAEGASFGNPTDIDWGGNLFVEPGYSTYETVVSNATFGRAGPQTQLPLAVLTADAAVSAGSFTMHTTFDWNSQLMRGVGVVVAWLECAEAAYWGILAEPI